MDITNEWTKTIEHRGKVIWRQSYTVEGMTYQVDGKRIVLEPLAGEMAVANILAKNYGKTVELIPKVNYPLGIQTPDYLIDGERFDLKSPKGRSRNLLYNSVAKKEKQSSNFIFDITNCPLPDEEVERQVQGLYASRHTRFIEKIIIMRNNEILKAYDRQ